MDENSKKYIGLESCYDLAKMEYERELERNEKLDNKISMTLTFCGVLFLFVLKYLNFMEIIEYNKVVIDIDFMNCLKIIMLFLGFSICYFFGKSVYILFSSIEARGYLHYRSNVIFDKNLPCEDEEKVKYYNTSLLVQATSKNRIVNENRVKAYNEAINLIKKTAICIAIMEFLFYTFFI